MELFSSWDHGVDDVWRQLDLALWEFTHNPGVVLQTVSRDQLQRMLSDFAFRTQVDALGQPGVRRRTESICRAGTRQQPMNCG